MRIHRFPPVRAGLALSIALLAACDSTPPACSSVFLAVTVTVVDTLGSPVTHASVTSTLARTGETLAATSWPS